MQCCTGEATPRAENKYSGLRRAPARTYCFRTARGCLSRTVHARRLARAARSRNQESSATTLRRADRERASTQPATLPAQEPPPGGSPQEGKSSLRSARPALRSARLKKASSRSEAPGRHSEVRGSCMRPRLFRLPRAAPARYNKCTADTKCHPTSDGYCRPAYP